MNMQTSFDFPLEGDTKPSLALRTKELLDKLLNFQLDIEAALVYSHGSYSFDDVVQGVLTGRFHFYPREQSFLLMELQTFPGYKIYHAFLAGGNLEELVSMQEEIRPIAKTLGAKYASLNGRHGWVKPLKALGWKHTYSTMYCEV